MCLPVAPGHLPMDTAGQGTRRCRLGTKPRLTSPLTWASRLPLSTVMPVPHPRRINVKSFRSYLSLDKVLRASWGFLLFLMPFLP